ncbi:hypothetical protein PSPO_b0923 [Pseudoalteromonas spongiae UST010723-006]|nr:hypothetical protein PSPO_b0923 [Pseudoalteromonas spongiae UST010723-006]
MSKTLCEWKRKEIEQKLEKLAALVNTPRFVCKKCARCANDKKSLCKPMPL